MRIFHERGGGRNRLGSVDHIFVRIVAVGELRERLIEPICRNQITLVFIRSLYLKSRSILGWPPSYDPSYK